MVGSSSGLMLNVFAKQPFSVTDTRPSGEPGDEVVLHRQRSVLAREGRRRLARAGKPDDQADAVAALGRDDLAPGVQRQAAALVDHLVPHPEEALLRLAEVVGVEDAGDALLEVDGDQAVVRHARRLEVRRVDDDELGLERLGILDREEQLLLHAGDVRVRGLDEQADGRAQVGLRAQVAVDHDHLAVGDVRVLLVDPLGRVVARDRPRNAGIVLVADHEGRRRRTGDDARFEVEVPELRPAGVRHLRRHLLELFGGRIVVDGGRGRQPEKCLHFCATPSRRRRGRANYSPVEIPACDPAENERTAPSGRPLGDSKSGAEA